MPTPEAVVTNDKIKTLSWAIALAGFLALFKAAGAVVSASQALWASALDSLMDLGVSTMNFISVKKGAKPPDRDHAYGHGKIESLASYTQGVVILLFAGMLLSGSARRSADSYQILHSGTAVFVVALSGLLNLGLTLFLDRAEKRTESLILKAEKTHYLMDLLSYGVILAALLLVGWTGWNTWDRLGAAAVSLYVGFLAFQILYRAGSELVDRSLPERVLEELDNLIKTHDPRILDYHEMRTRRAGNTAFIDFHLVIKQDESFQDAHSITESLIEKIRTRFRDADVTIHEDPEGGM
jgi:cation diffusion facilitator family transporter